MFATQLVQMIETHSQKLAEGLMHKVQTDERLRDYRKIPLQEVQDRAQEIYQHLSDWLLTKTEAEIETRYMEIGARRALQGVSLSSVIYALSLTKENLWEYVKREGLVERYHELWQELEFLQQVEKFFDRAIFYVARGYERSHNARVA